MAISQRRLAILTGASSGIGLAFAESLAKRGMDLVVIARRGERLEALASRLEKDAGISVRVIVADLLDQSALRSVAQEIEKFDCVDLLVNSAGFGTYGSFAAIDSNRIENELFLDLIVPAAFARAVIPKMIKRKQGAIINVSSMAAFLPIPEFTTYCAAKAGLTRLTEALHGELIGTGVRVQALCPGPVPTEFFAISGYDADNVPSFMFQSAEACAESSLSALEKGQVVYIPHLAIRLFVAFIKLFSLTRKVRILGGGPEWWTKKYRANRQRQRQIG